MNAELEKQLAELVSAAKQTGTDVASFIAQQAPDVFEQIIAWERFQYGAGLVLGLAVIGVLWVKATKLLKADKRGDADELLSQLLFAVIIVVPFLCVALVAVPGLVKTYIAPKLIVLDYIARHL